MRLAFVAVIALASAITRAGTINVAAAISLRESMDEIGQQFEKMTGDHAEFNYGASGTLMTQIKSGAPVDVFLSAAAAQMNELVKASLIKEDSRKTIAMNRLVLVIPKSADAAAWKDGFKTLSTDTLKKLAIGEPKSVPAGMYAEQALKKLGMTELTSKIIYGANVRQVLSYVERGEVSAGIVYATDAMQSGDKVQIIATADAGWHEPIVYPGAILNRSEHGDIAQHFLDFLSSTAGREALKRHGFAVDDAAPTSRP